MSKQVLKISAATLAVLVLCWLVFAINKKTNPQTTDEDLKVGAYKVGLVFPMTGDAASYGEPAREVYLLAQEQINSQGGINGSPLEFVMEDGKCDGTIAANAVQKLITIDKVKVISGFVCSSEALAAIPIAEANEAFIFGSATSSPDLTGKSQWFARAFTSDTTQGAVLASTAKSENLNFVVALVEQKDYPLGIYNFFQQQFENLGGRTQKEEFAPETKDFRSQLTKLRDSNPDALFLDMQAPPTAEVILQQMQEMGWSPRIILSDSPLGDPALISKYSRTLENALGAEVSVNTDNPSYKKFIFDFENKYGHSLDFPAYGQVEYDSIMLLAEGLRKVGNSPRELSQWIRQVKDWEGVSGNITITADGDRLGGHIPKIIHSGVVQRYK